jgi:hypothetical protein
MSNNLVDSIVSINIYNGILSLLWVGWELMDEWMEERLGSVGSDWWG